MNMTLYRNVRVVASNGRSYDVPLTAEQAAFYLRMAEYRAVAEPSITFGDLLAAKSEKERRRERRQSS
jgi:hypothetical protein